METDHQPLVSVVLKPLNSAPSRLQRMLLKLQKFHLKVTYKMARVCTLLILLAEPICWKYTHALLLRNWKKSTTLGHWVWQTISYSISSTCPQMTQSCGSRGRPSCEGGHKVSQMYQRAAIVHQVSRVCAIRVPCTYGLEKHTNRGTRHQSSTEISRSSMKNPSSYHRITITAWIPDKGR